MQGGEPTLLGVDFFRQSSPPGQTRQRKVHHNALQTNATLIDNQWASFSLNTAFSLAFPSTALANSTITTASTRATRQPLTGSFVASPGSENTQSTSTPSPSSTAKLAASARCLSLPEGHRQWIHAVHPVVERQSAPASNGLTLIQPTLRASLRHGLVRRAACLRQLPHPDLRRVGPPRCRPHLCSALRRRP